MLQHYSVLVLPQLPIIKAFLSRSVVCAHCNIDGRTLRNVVLLHVLTHAILMCKTVRNVHCHISDLQYLHDVPL
jgi:hypothetical protein